MQLIGIVFVNWRLITKNLNREIFHKQAKKWVGWLMQSLLIYSDGHL